MTGAGRIQGEQHCVIHNWKADPFSTPNGVWGMFDTVYIKLKVHSFLYSIFRTSKNDKISGLNTCIIVMWCLWDALDISLHVIFIVDLKFEGRKFDITKKNLTFPWKFVWFHYLAESFQVCIEPRDICVIYVWIQRDISHWNM